MSSRGWLSRTSPSGLTPLRVIRNTWSRPQFDINEADRMRGIHVVAGSGSGKSLLIGGNIAFGDFMRDTPQVLFDPVGSMIDAFLMRIASVPNPTQDEFCSRILYVDMSARGAHVVPFPLLYELGGETRHDVAERFLATCLAIDPQLQSASIQGWNALQRTGLPVGIILASLGLQLDSAMDLLRRPEAWAPRLNEAVVRHPDAAPAVAFIRDEYIPATPSRRTELTASYRAKVEPFTLDPSMRAMFCSTPSGVDWHRVMADRLTVLLDFRGETNPGKRLFKTRAAFDYVREFVRHRGPGAHLPLALHIDELTELTNAQSLDQSLFARDLDYLLNVLMRGFSCPVTVAHQSMHQVAEPTMKTLMTMGTHVIGVTSDVESAEFIARHFVPLDPRRVKRMERVWTSEHVPANGLVPAFTNHFVIDERTVDLPLDEQLYVASRAFMNLRPFEYLIKPKGRSTLVHASIKRHVGNPWPTDHADLLSDLRNRLARQACSAVVQIAPQGPIPSVTMESDVPHDPRDDDDQLDPLYWCS